MQITKTEFYSNGVIVQVTKEFDGVEFVSQVDVDQFDNSDAVVERFITDQGETFYAYNDDAAALVDEKIWDAGAYVVHVQMD